MTRYCSKGIDALRLGWKVQAAYGRVYDCYLEIDDLDTVTGSGRHAGIATYLFFTHLRTFLDA